MKLKLSLITLVIVLFLSSNVFGWTLRKYVDSMTDEVSAEMSSLDPKKVSIYGDFLMINNDSEVYVGTERPLSHGTASPMLKFGTEEDILLDNAADELLAKFMELTPQYEIMIRIDKNVPMTFLAAYIKSENRFMLFMGKGGLTATEKTNLYVRASTDPVLSEKVDDCMVGSSQTAAVLREREECLTSLLLKRSPGKFDRFITQLKKGNYVNVRLPRGQGHYDMKFSLTGFTKAFNKMSALKKQ